MQRTTATVPDYFFQPGNCTNLTITGNWLMQHFWEQGLLLRNADASKCLLFLYFMFSSIVLYKWTLHLVSYLCINLLYFLYQTVSVSGPELGHLIYLYCLREKIMDILVLCLCWHYAAPKGSSTQAKSVASYHCRAFKWSSVYSRSLYASGRATATLSKTENKMSVGEETEQNEYRREQM